MTMPVAIGETLAVYTFTSTAPTELRPIMFADGSSAVVWSTVDTTLDPSFTGVFARFFDETGAPRGGVVRLNTVTTQNQNLPEIVLLETGNLLVSWYSDSSAPPPPSGTISFGGEVVAQIVSPSGALIGGEIVLPAAPYGYETPATNTPARTVTALPGGGFAAAWVDFPGGIASGTGTVTLQMRIFDANGAALTGDILVDTLGGLNTFDKVDVDTTSDGRIFISYRERVDSSTKQSYGRFYEADGDPLGAAFAIGAVERNAFKSLVEPLSGGRIVYVHELTGQASYRVVVLNEAGVATSAVVSLGEKGDVGSVVERPDGGFIVTFTDTTLGSGSNNDVLMQGFTAAGALDGSPIPLPGTNAGSDTAGNASPLVGGRMLTTWLAGFELKAQVYAFPVQPGAGPDGLPGGPGNDTIDGLGGNDTIDGFGGNDSLTGSEGVDLLRGSDGNDTLNGGAGADNLVGGVGYDTADFTGAGAAVTVELWRADAVTGILFATDGTGSFDQMSGFEALIGGAAGDVLSGDSIANSLQGGGGNDTLNGGFGDDYVDGGANEDYLFGAVGADTVLGGLGNDTIFGGDAGFSGGDLADSLVGGDGADFLIGELGNDTLDGGLNDDFLVGGYFGSLVSGNDSMLGGDGLDTLLGEDGTDTLDGGNQDDFIIGGIGNDSIRGGDGVDFIVADGFGTETGDDTIDGGLGNDVIIGGLGNDRYTGGGGNDQFWITLTAGQSSGTKTISDYDLVNDSIVIDAVNPAALTFAAIQGLMTQTGANVTFSFATLGHPTTSLVIENRTIAQLQADDFIVF